MCLALVDHDKTKVLARTRSGNLKLSEDSAGLAFELSIPDTSAGRDVLEAAQRSDLGGMCFGFHVPKDGERWQGNKRELVAVDLREISVVWAWPAYPETTVMARMRTPESTGRCATWRPADGISDTVARWAPLTPRDEVETRDAPSSWDLLAAPALPGIVNPHVAENLATVLACVSAISSTSASLPAYCLPRDCYRARVLYQHPIATLIALGPNASQTWCDWLEAHRRLGTPAR